MDKSVHVVVGIGKGVTTLQKIVSHIYSSGRPHALARTYAYLSSFLPKTGKRIFSCRFGRTLNDALEPSHGIPLVS